MVSLLLQPVFLDLARKEQTRSAGASTPVASGTASADGVTTDNATSDETADGKILNVNEPILQRLSVEDLYSMWSIATKVKSSIVEGHRLENLSWRLWYSSSRARTQANSSSTDVMVATSSPTNELAIGGEGGGCGTTRSQATNIPRIKPATCTSCTAILAEIQQASARHSTTISPYFMPDHSPAKPNPLFKQVPPSPLEERVTGNSNGGGGSISSDSSTTKPGGCPSSTSSTSSSLQSGGNRRRKKNVDKFIRKQNLQLEKIAEQAEEGRAPSSLTTHHLDALEPTKAPPVSKAGTGITDASSLSATETISVDSLISESSPPNPALSDGSGALFRRPVFSEKVSSPHSDRPNISLLTMLLNRQAAIRRPGSCPPPLFGASPPSRPSGPLPSLMTHDQQGKTSPFSDHSQPSCTSTQQPMPGQLLQTLMQSETAIAIANDTRPTPSQANPPRRRPPVPNTFDLNKPLFIW